MIHNHLTIRQAMRDTLDALPPFPGDLPRNRLGLAKWVMQPDQPLTLPDGLGQLVAGEGDLANDIDRHFIFRGRSRFPQGSRGSTFGARRPTSHARSPPPSPAATMR